MGKRVRDEINGSVKDTVIELYWRYGDCTEYPVHTPVFDEALESSIREKSEALDDLALVLGVIGCN